MIVAESVKRRSHTRTRRETIKEEKRYKLQFLKREMKNRSRHACRTCFFLLKKASREQSTFSPALQSSAAQGKLLLRQVLLRPSWLTFFPPSTLSSLFTFISSIRFCLVFLCVPNRTHLRFLFSIDAAPPVSFFWNYSAKPRRSSVDERVDEIDEEERAARGGITGYWCLFFLLVKHQSK